MSRSALIKDALRTVVRAPARFLSILAIVAIGCAVFVGLKAVAPDMKNTADSYFDEYNMMDIRVLSTLGLTGDDISEIRKISGVEKVQPGYFLDVTTYKDSKEYVYRIHSLPNNVSTTKQTVLNRPKLTEGRLPNKSGETVIEDSRFYDIGIEIGDTITVSSGTSEGLAGKLRFDTFTVVGKVVSPYYLTFDREATSIGSGQLGFFMMVLEKDFDYPVYTEALVSVENAAALNTYSSEYEQLVDRVRGDLENLGQERAGIRLEEIKQLATEQLDEGRAELAAKEAEYNDQIANGEARLQEASNELAAGRAQLATEREAYARQMEMYRQQIAQGESALADAEQQYAAARDVYDSYVARAREMGAFAEAAGDALIQAKRNSDEQLASLEAQLNDPNLTEEQLQTVQEQYDRELQTNRLLTEAMIPIESLTAQISEPFLAAKQQLDVTAAQLQTARASINDAKWQMANAEATANSQFAQAEQDLAAGQASYDQAYAEFQALRKDGAQQIQEGHEKIIRAENDIERLSAPTWYVLDRNMVYSYVDYSLTADRMNALSALFPVFFAAVAALVCVTTMTRMIDEQRSAIGTYKALGYGNGSIAVKYIGFAALASLLGGVIGVVVGMRTFPRVVFNSWRMLYELPPIVELPQYELQVATVIAAALLMMGAGYIAVRGTLVPVPAALMRPKAPPPGKVILLERFTPFWSRLSFSQKVTVRNIFRYKKRFLMTVLGIAGCSALLVAGLGLSDSIGRVVPRQFGEIQRFDMVVRLAGDRDRTLDAAVDDVLRDQSVSAAMTVAQVNATVKGEGGEIAATMYVPEKASQLPDFVSLQERRTGNVINLPEEGVVMNEKLAGLMKVGVGDMISIDNGNGLFKTVVVAGINENYIFNYLYMDPDYYKQIYRLAPDMNARFVQLTPDGLDLEEKLGTAVMNTGQVAEVTYHSEARAKFYDTITSLNTIVYVMIACAGLLAFVVLYSLTNTNVSERLREIATIKVLGFRDGEVASYVYRENMLLTFIGGVTGLLVGIGLHRTIMQSIEQENVMFGDYIALISFGYAIALTLVFGLFVNLVMYPKLINIKMVESLKSIE